MQGLLLGGIIMSIYKKNEKWYYNFMIDGVRYHKAIKGCSSHKDAIKAENIVKSELMRGRYELVESTTNTTLAQAIELYLEYSKANKKSYKLDENYCKVFIEHWGKNSRLKDLTPQKIEKFKSIMKTNRQNSTVNRYLEALSKMFNIAISNNLAKENPLKEVKKLKQNNYKIRFLTKEEEAALFKVLRENKNYNYFIPIVTCALQTGMRKGEILNLKWSNIDFKKQFIELLQTKSGKARKIPISNKLMKALVLLKENKISEYVFANPYTKTKYKFIHKGFDEALRKADIMNFRFHDLRHTAATRMTEMGIDLAVVQEILGHSDVKTTMRYAHPVPERKLKAIEILNNY